MSDPEINFDPKSVDADALELIPTGHQLPSDRQIEMIKNRKVAKGQFGIRTLLVLVLIISVICALPEILGWNSDEYWLGIFVAVFLFAPMLGFITAALANYYGFKTWVRKCMGWFLGVLAGGPVLILMIISGGTDLVQAIGVVCLSWLPQFGEDRMVQMAIPKKLSENLLPYSLISLLCVVTY